MVSLAFIGFWPMVSDLLYGLFAYSIYLTLHKFSIMLYIISLGFGVLYGLWNIFPFEETSQLLFYTLNLLFYGFGCFFVWNSNRRYRESVKTLTKESLLERKMVDEAMKKAGSKMLEATGKAMASAAAD